MRYEFKWGKRIINLAFDISSKRYDMRYMRGITNRTKDGLYCVFLEYDNIILPYVEDELKRLQAQFELSAFLVVKSSKNSYHCYCFDKVPYKLYREIQDNATIDKKWVSFPINHGTHNWVLRYTPKKNNRIKPIRIVYSEHSKYQQSRPHLLLVEKIFNISLKSHNLDTESNLYIGGYYI